MVNQSENRPRWRLQPPTKGVQMGTVCMFILLLRPLSPLSLVPDPPVFSTVGALQTKALLHRVDMLKGNPTNGLQVRIFHHAREINLLLFGDWLVYAWALGQLDSKKCYCIFYSTDSIYFVVVFFLTGKQYF